MTHPLLDETDTIEDVDAALVHVRDAIHGPHRDKALQFADDLLEARLELTRRTNP